MCCRKWQSILYVTLLLQMRHIQLGKAFSNNVPNAFIMVNSNTDRLKTISSLEMSAAVKTASDTSSHNKRPRLSRFSRRRKENKDGSSIEMRFTGRHRVSSPTISDPKDVRVLDEFFAVQKNRNLLFPYNDASSSNAPPTKTQIHTWTREAELGGCNGPVLDRAARYPVLRNDRSIRQTIFQISAPLQMPGLKIVSESTIGMKLLLANDDNGVSPEYQFTLLHSKVIPQGPLPVVWLFNQLMKYRDTTSSFTRVRAETVGSNSERLAFVTEARLETSIRLPSKILKVLPNVDVRKFEEQGSEAVQKLLEKDLGPALCVFCTAYEAYAKEQLQCQEREVVVLMP